MRQKVRIERSVLLHGGLYPQNKISKDAQFEFFFSHTYAGTTTHTFETAGTYFLSCQERNTNISATVVVTDGENVPWGVKRHLRPLLYTHVALMAAAFAVLFPLAAFTHYHGLTLAYKVLLPLGMLLALCGLVLVVVYAELTRQKHFHFFIHGAVGLALLFLCLIVMPLLLLYKKLRVFSYRAGHVVAFFGMGNVLLVSESHQMAIFFCFDTFAWCPMHRIEVVTSTWSTIVCTIIGTPDCGSSAPNTANL